MAKKLYIILDAAHGANVKGKCSPDETHKEYLWSRQMCDELQKMLRSRGYEVKQTNLTIDEIGLSKRKEYANSIITEPGQIKFLISLHNNAAGENGWHNARGFEIYTTKGQTRSDAAADVIMGRLNNAFSNFKSRIDKSDGDLDKEANFTVLMGNYMAVLIEWLFMDNKEDLAYLKDPVTNTKFLNAIVEAIELIENDPKYSSYYL